MKKVFQNKVVQGLLETAIWEDVSENADAESYEMEAGECKYEGEITFDFKIVEFELYETFDEEEEIVEIIEITEVKDINPDKLLEASDIEYSTSNRSKSYYLQLADGEHRVSDHKRPAIVDGLIAHEHVYENEHICGGEKEIYDTIKELVIADRYFKEFEAQCENIRKERR